MEGFPSFGSWVPYALGSENENLPALSQLMIHGDLPALERTILGVPFTCRFSGTDFSAKQPPANLIRPVSYSQIDDRSTISLLQKLNGKHLERYPGDANLAAGSLAMNFGW